MSPELDAAGNNINHHTDNFSNLCFRTKSLLSRHYSPNPPAQEQERVEDAGGGCLSDGFLRRHLIWSPASPPPPPPSQSQRWLEDFLLALDMASPRGGLNSPYDTPQEIRRQKLNGKQKREALEKEVSVLEKMLDQEERTREVLQRVQGQRDGQAITVPTFLPPKTKELLAELAMVEGEISRLEFQISKLQKNLNEEQEQTRRTKSKQWQQTVQESQQQPPVFPPPSPMNNGGKVMNSTTTNVEKPAFETKALHFISKVIKGDNYMASSLINNGSEKNKRVTRVSSPVRSVFFDQKENDHHQFHHETNSKVTERLLRGSGVVKPASPMRESRFSSPKPRERVSLGTSLDLPPKSLSAAIAESEDRQKSKPWHPNKLSENILKCLNFIYIRLLRTTRTMELEKSGPTSRSSSHYSSLSSRSFRVDSSPISKPTNLMVYKDSRQQDPYGVFNVDDSIPRDIGPYKNLVIFTSSSMDPKCISSSSSVSLIRKLQTLINNLQSVNLRALNYQQKLAFWINMYNACIMNGFLQFGAPTTAEKMLSLMEKATINIGGHTMNAHAIERYILRKSPPSNKREGYQKGDEEDKEIILRKLYGLESFDPNITFALSCGTRSSPAIRIYTADSVTPELERSKLEYMQASIVVTSKKRVGLPEILVRHVAELAGDVSPASSSWEHSVVEWVCQQLPTSGTLRKSMVDCFRGSNSGRVSSSSSSSSFSSSAPALLVEKIPYDFEFQYLLAI